jgi:predicted nucleic acid-binding protein
MIAYVESNFLLEIVLGQEQAASAESLLQLAEYGTITLVAPCLALAEPFATITQRERTRRKLVNDISATLRDLQRSTPYQGEVTLVSQAVNALASITGRELASLQAATQRLLATATIIELESARFAQALAYQSQYGLLPQDSIIYACVVSDLQARPPTDLRCFVTRNSRDFDDPAIVAELNAYGCRLFFSFEDGLRYCTP